MARPHRNTPGGYCYHVLSRGNARQRVFHKPADYEAFVGLFTAAHEVVPMRLLAYCLMPNHFHLVRWPREDGDLSRWMQWLLTTHVCRYHEHHQTTGHERNPLRANLVKSAALWPHSSLRLASSSARPPWYSEGPVKRGKSWERHVDQPQTEAELLALRRSVERGIPYGGDRWQQKTVTALGLESTLRSRGRPRKQINKA